MSLDLGELLGSVDLIITPFERKYGQVISMMDQLSATATRTAAGAGVLDEGLAGVAESSAAASTGLAGATTALRGAGLSASQSVPAIHAVSIALDESVDVTTELGLAQSKLTQATLRQAAAAQRVADVQASGAMIATRLAAAEADLTKIQLDEAASADKVAAAQAKVDALNNAAVANTGRLSSALASQAAMNDRVTLSQERLEKTAGWSERYRAAAGPLAVAGGLVAAGFYEAEKAATQFDAKMALNESLLRSNSKSTQELAGWMGQLRQQALTAGTQYGYTATQVADAQSELIKAGISVKDILGGALTGALTLAAAGQEDVAEATETAAIAMTQFKLQGKDVPHIADLLAAGADRALGSVADLSEGLKYGGVASSQAGESLENTIGTLAEFAQAGLIGSSAGSALSMMLQNLQKPSKEAAALMDQYDISLYNADGTTKSYTQIAGNLHKSLADLPPAERSAALATIFTARARRAATILTLDGAKANAQWTDTVNAQGFAALQAGGKLNSLSGDWLKFKAAFSSALIQNGQGAQGPLRDLVQDATKVLDVWEKIPGPLRSGAEVLALVGGAAALSGAAALIAVPKWISFTEALEGTRLGAISTSSALNMIGKGGLALAAVTGLYVGIKALSDEFNTTTSPSVTQFTSDLIRMRAEANALDDPLSKQLTDIAELGDAFGSAGRLLGNLDGSLASLVTSGHLDDAELSFNQVSEALRRGGMSTADITKLFPQFSSALQDSSNSAKEAGTGVDQYGNAVSAAAKKTKDATAAEKQYSDTLHALSDPVFGLQSALSQLGTAQGAYNKAVAQHGADSKQARDADLALAQQMVATQDAATTLAGSVQSGHTSMAALRTMTDSLARSMGLSKGQVRDLIGQFQGLINTSDRLNKERPHIQVSDNSGSVNDNLKSISSTAAKVARQAVADLNAAKGQARTSGLYLSEGYAGGILAGVGGVESAARRVVAAALSQVQRAQDSHSPSREAAKRGVMFGEGYAVGMLASLPKIVGAAHAMVAAAIAAATAPASSDPNVLAGLLGASESTAISKRVTSEGAKTTYQDLQEYARAQQLLANAADKAAAAAKRKADAAKDDTAAEKANKDQLDATAKSLQQQANVADRAAKQAATAADAGKKAWDKAKTAADSAAQAAASAAQALVSNLQQAADQMQSTISDFKGQITSGLTGDDSLSTIWGNLIDAQTSAASALADAQSSYADAQAAVVSAGADATTDQLQAVTDAQNLLTKAQGAADQANAGVSAAGVQSGVGAVLTNVQQFLSDLKALIADGASQTEIDEIVGMGPGAGDQFAKALIGAGANLVTQLSSTLDQIQSLTSSAADQMADTFYGGGVSSMQQFIAGLEDSYPELRAALTPILTELQGLFGGVAGSGGAVSSPVMSVPAGVPAPTLHIGKSGIIAQPSPAVLPAGSVLGGDGATQLTVRLHPDDIAAVAEAVANGPTPQIVLDKQVVGVAANDVRQAKREQGTKGWS